MSNYVEFETGMFTDGKRSFSAASSSYARALSEVGAGDSTIDYWEGSQLQLEALRGSKLEEINTHAIATMAAAEPVISTSEMVAQMVMLWPMLDTASASAELLLVRDIYNYSKTKRDQLATATKEEIEAYDPATDVSWPN